MTGERRGGHPGATSPPSGWPPGSLLDRLLPPARAALLGSCRTTRFRPGEHLLRQGDTDRHAILLLRGLAKVRIVDRRGLEVLLAVRGRGELIGELAALTGLPRTATVVAVDDITGGVISGPALISVLAQHPDAAREMIRTQGDRLEWANRRRVAFTSGSAQSKIAQVVADLAEEVDDEPRRVALSQRELASLAGIKLNTAERALRRLSDSGLIERRYRAIVVLNRDGLRAIAELDP